jgi:hypothetical protein
MTYIDSLTLSIPDNLAAYLFNRIPSKCSLKISPHAELRREIKIIIDYSREIFIIIQGDPNHSGPYKDSGHQHLRQRGLDAQDHVPDREGAMQDVQL